LSPVWQRFAEGLTATHYQVFPLSIPVPFQTSTNTYYKKPNFNKVAAEHNLELIDDDRGAPENKGLDFTASQYAPYQTPHNSYN